MVLGKPGTFWKNDDFPGFIPGGDISVEREKFGG